VAQLKNKTMFQSAHFNMTVYRALLCIGSEVMTVTCHISYSTCIQCLSLKYSCSWLIFRYRYITKE